MIEDMIPRALTHRWAMSSGKEAIKFNSKPYVSILVSCFVYELSVCNLKIMKLSILKIIILPASSNFGIDNHNEQSDLEKVSLRNARRAKRK
jgi:hypothetical protein